MLQEHHQRLGAGWKSILVERAVPPWQLVPSYEAGFATVQWCSIPGSIAIRGQTDYQISLIAPLPLLCWCHVMMPRQIRKRFWWLQTKPQDQWHRLPRHFHQDLQLTYLGYQEERRQKRWKHHLLDQGCSFTSSGDKRLLTNIAIKTAGFKWAHRNSSDWKSCSYVANQKQSNSKVSKSRPFPKTTAPVPVEHKHERTD